MAIFRGILVALAMSALLACSEEKAPEAPAPQQAAAPAHPATPVHPQAANNRGRVISNTAVGGYSYIEVDVGGQNVWLAANRVNVEPGSEITWGNYAVMRNFNSQALNRTFDQILFVSTVSSPSLPAANATSGKAVSVATAGGYTYIEVEVPGGSKWLAAPAATVKQGDTVSWNGGATMRNFTSSSLNRTFDEIVFVGGVQVAN